MTAWVVRGGPQGEREAEALDNGVVTMGFHELGDLSGVPGQAGFTAVMRNMFPDWSQPKISNHASQIRYFVEEIQPGDLAVMPRKGTEFVAVGTFSGGYFHRPDAGDLAHGRRVNWVNTEVRRDQLEDDLKGFLFANRTVFRPRAAGAEERLRALAEAGRSEGPREVSPEVSVTNESQGIVQRFCGALVGFLRRCLGNASGCRRK